MQPGAMPGIVARSARAWIETLYLLEIIKMVVSHALRVRGLKRRRAQAFWYVCKVARSARAWIETEKARLNGNRLTVARSARAWIETPGRDCKRYEYKASHALRVRGLKHCQRSTVTTS